jgi:hypothetical protein
MSKLDRIALIRGGSAPDIRQLVARFEMRERAITQ